jgi:hypothetical protein
MTASPTTLATPAARPDGKSAKHIAVSIFEWFGELGTFCARLGRGAFTPPAVKEF